MQVLIVFVLAFHIFEQLAERLNLHVARPQFLTPLIQDVFREAPSEVNSFLFRLHDWLIDIELLSVVKGVRLRALQAVFEIFDVVCSLADGG